MNLNYFNTCKELSEDIAFKANNIVLDMNIIDIDNFNDELRNQTKKLIWSTYRELEQIKNDDDFEQYFADFFKM